MCSSDSQGLFPGVHYIESGTAQSLAGVVKTLVAAYRIIDYVGDRVAKALTQRVEEPPPSILSAY